MIRIYSQGLLSGFNCFLQLSNLDVFVYETVEGVKVMRIDFTPQLASFNLIYRFARCVLVIPRLNIKLFFLTDVLSPFKGFSKIRVSDVDLAEIAGYRREPG